MSAEGISESARRLHFSSIVADAHTDTPQRFLFDQFDLAEHDAEGSVDIPRLRLGGVGAIFFAMWVPVEITGAAAAGRAFDLLAATKQQIKKHAADLMLAVTAEEVRAARRQNKIAVLLGVEGGHAIDNDLGILREFAARGVRYMTLTHNAATDWADSSNAEPRHRGLTDFGREVVREMNRLGMIVDVSHVSDETFRDVLEASIAPVMASHSCCRAICNAPRNLTDSQIRALAGQGGVMHITFHKAFLSQEYADAARALAPQIALREEGASGNFVPNEARKLLAGQKASDELTREGKLPRVGWEKIVEHIQHAVKLVGANHAALGSDFDGAYMPKGLEDASGFPKITEALLESGMAESDVRSILGENTLRVLSECERIAAGK